MKFPSLLVMTLTTALLTYSQIIFAAEQPSPPNELIIQKDKVFDPNKLSMDSIQAYEKRFDYDWDNDATIESNKQKIEDIESFLNTNPDFSAMTTADKQSLGKILYKLGTYYTYVARKPTAAIVKLNLADSLLSGKSDKAWNYNHLAYAYDLKYSESGDDAEKEKSLTYINKVIALYHNANNKEVAFAYCVKGLVENDAKKYAETEAEANFKHALALYEKMPNGKDDQYARTKYRLATIILGQSGREPEALSLLQDLQNYWNKKGDGKPNPNAARNALALAQAELKMNKAEDARDEIKKVIVAYEALYGKDSQQLVEPYQLLADTYKKLGDKHLAEVYQIKANELDKS